MFPWGGGNGAKKHQMTNIKVNQHQICMTLTNINADQSAKKKKKKNMSNMSDISRDIIKLSGSPHVNGARQNKASWLLLQYFSEHHRWGLLVALLERYSQE